MVPMVAILASQRDLPCNFSESMVADSNGSVVFVRGWTAPSKPILPIQAARIFPNGDKSGHRFSYKRKRGEKSPLCLFDSQSSLDDTKDNVLDAMMFKETQRKVTSYSSNVEKNEEDFLMNPLEDFAAGQEESNDIDEYTRGLWTVGFITLLFATRTPVLKWAFASGGGGILAPPPVLLVNASVSLVALAGLLLGDLWTAGDQNTKCKDDTTTSNSWLVGGLELGAWKFLGATSYLNGLALTTASHGALLVQMTTLIVPTTRAIVYKESAPVRLQLAIVLALVGVFCFVYDPTGTATSSLLGDSLCVVAAVCFSAQDLRLYEYGKQIEGSAKVQRLVTTKTGTQAFLSIGLLLLAPFASLLSSGGAASSFSPRQESLDYLHTLAETSPEVWAPVVAALLWIAVAVNAIAPLFQVGGQQILGPTKCQTIYASQPLWAAMLSTALLGERLGPSGVVGGIIFLVALALAATAATTE